jgi:hypothetical protein
MNNEQLGFPFLNQQPTNKLCIVAEEYIDHLIEEHKKIEKTALECIHEYVLHGDSYSAKDAMIPNILALKSVRIMSDLLDSVYDIATDRQKKEITTLLGDEITQIY